MQSQMADIVQYVWDHYNLTIIVFIVCCILQILLEPVLRQFVSTRTHMLTFECIAGVCCTLQTVIGAYMMLSNDLNGSKLEGYSQLAATLTEVMLGYQLFNTVLCLVLEEMRKIPMIVHHLATCTVAGIGMLPFAHGYAWFFFGIVEASNIVLTAIDIFKMYPSLISKYQILYERTRMLFAFLYIIIRLIWWPIMSYEFGYGVITGVHAGTLKHPIGGLIMWSCNLVLTFLQLFWGKIIVSGVIKALSGSPSSSKKADPPINGRSDKKAA